MENYGELKDAIQRYLYDRKDLGTIIPTLVQLSEQRIYRKLRCPANEQVLNFELEGSSFDVPSDYLEAKIFLCNGVPLRRISDIEYSARRVSAPVGEPARFARLADKFYIDPAPDEKCVITLIYWQDFSGNLELDTDTNEILRIAPALYVYGAMVEAMPYLAHDSRSDLWNMYYNQAVAQLNEQTVEAEFSGSNVFVGAVYGDNSGPY